MFAGSGPAAASVSDPLLGPGRRAGSGNAEAAATSNSTQGASKARRRGKAAVPANDAAAAVTPVRGSRGAASHSSGDSAPSNGGERSRSTNSAPSTGYESYDYQPSGSAVYAAELATKQPRDYRGRSAIRWLLTLAVGVSVALLATAVTWVASQLTSLKFSAMQRVIRQEQAGSAAGGSALLTFVAISLALAAAGAGVTAFIEPAAAGSGISEIKCVLAGIRLPRVLRLKTLLVKMAGNTFAVASGLPLGKEGPMIHAGAIVGAGISQGKSTSLGCIDTRWSVYREFRNDAEKRDFVTCGAAAGVAAAFGAPIGGVLFAIEEGASTWSRQLVWRGFACAVCTAYVLELLLSGTEDGEWGKLSTPGLFSFGNYVQAGQRKPWNAWEIPGFVVMGALGGLLGAAFVALNKRITLKRYASIPASSPTRRFAEVALLNMAFSLTTFGVSYVAESCRPRPVPTPSVSAPMASAAASSGPASLLLANSGSPSAEPPSLWSPGAAPASPVATGPRSLGLLGHLTRSLLTSSSFGSVRASGPTAPAGDAFTLPRASAGDAAAVTAAAPTAADGQLHAAAPGSDGMPPTVSGFGASPSPSPAPAGPAPGYSYESDLQSFYCPDSQWNELASMFMVPAEDAIRQLFHFDSDFGLGHLAIFGCIYTAFACLVYGIAVPSGLFVPSLLAGSAFGRFIGQALNLALPASSAVDPGVYSLIGAAAVLGGFTRMTISLSVILIESTGSYIYALPTFLTLLTARFVGNMFNVGIYDLHIRLREWPLLLPKPPKAAVKELRVADIMSGPPVVFQEVEKVGTVLDTLLATSHHGFPVVYGSQALSAYGRLGTLAGLIHRRHLAGLLSKRAFHAAPPSIPLSALLEGAAAGDAEASTVGAAPGAGSMVGATAQAMPGTTGGYAVPTAVSVGLDHDTPVANSRNPAAGAVMHNGRATAGASPAAALQHGGGAVGAGASAIGSSGSGCSSSSSSSSYVVTSVPVSNSGAAKLFSPTMLAAVRISAAPPGAAVAAAVSPSAAGVRGAASPAAAAGAPGSKSTSGSGGYGSFSTTVASGAADTRAGLGQQHATMALPGAPIAAATLIDTSAGSVENSASASGDSDSDNDSSDNSGSSDSPYSTSSDEEPSVILASLVPRTSAAAGAGAAPASTGTPASLSGPMRGSLRLSTGASATASITAGNGAGPGAAAAALMPGLRHSLAYGTAASRPINIPSSASSTAATRGKTGSSSADAARPPAVSLQQPSVSSLLSTSPFRYRQPSAASSSALPAVIAASDLSHLISRSRAGSVSYQADAAAAVASASGSLSSRSLVGLGGLDEVPSVDASAAHAAASTTPLQSARGGGGAGIRGSSSAVAATVSTAAAGAVATVGAGVSIASAMKTSLAGDTLTELVYPDEPLVPQSEFAAMYPRYPHVSSLQLSAAEREMYIDLRPYMNPAPHTVSVHADLPAAHHLFTSLALRHLLVVNDCHDVVGILTRANWLPKFLEQRRMLKERLQLAAQAAASSAGAVLKLW